MDDFTNRKEMIKALFNEGKIKPMRFKELAGFLNVPKNERDDLSHILDELINEGLIAYDDSGKYGLSKMRTYEGTFQATDRGFGFVIVDGLGEDVFVPERYTLNAINGDKVVVAITAEGNKNSEKRRSMEGRIISIVEHGTTEIVGIVQKNKNFAFVLPDNQKYNFDVYIPNGKTMGAVSGSKVVCKLTFYGDNKRNPEGEIIEILGHINDPGVDILSIVRAFGIPDIYPEEVLEEIKNVPEQIDPCEIPGRTDIRHLPTVTIDGEDAKDLDDAITLYKEGDIYKLGVHIADVSNYVKEGSPLDKEALNRGTSVYLTDRVIPMLPHVLSNGICSLNEGEDRLALSCFMDIDSSGRIIAHSIEETVINVNHRMSYTDVYAIITDSNPETAAKYSDFVDNFKLMLELSQILRKRRHERGSIDFDIPECKIELDERGKVKEIAPYIRNSAHLLIEDFMLAANETVAEEFFWMDHPFVYRTHEEPDSEKLENLKVFVKNFGLKLHIGNEIHGKEIQKLLSSIAGTPEEALISRLTLRSMKQARYSTECTGHFGLASKYYCHFTSPIRRYPDLQIHRIIKEYIHGMDDSRLRHYQTILGEVCTKCSVTERRAEEAERETDKLKKTEYMSRFLGESFEGVISGLTNWGIYVELPNTCEGLIRFINIPDDRYELDKTGYKVVSRRSGKEFYLGQKIKVTVINCDKVLRTIDFIPVPDIE